MTQRKVRKVLSLYQNMLEARVGRAVECDHNALVTGNQALGHCLSMIPQMREFIKEKRMDKVFRWLGFMQGVFWNQGIYTLEELKNHNRPN